MDTDRGNAYRPDIDGLRAIAVLGVVAFHSGLPHVPGGFVGVDVFFVISGYLITGLLSAELERTGSIDLRAFFARRVRRLMPALVLVVLATLAVAAFSMFPRELHRLGKSAQAVGLIGANVHFRNFTGGYFDPSTDLMPLLHTWSLAVEEQYYLIWPLLLLLMYKLRRPTISGVHRGPVLALLLIFAASLAGCVWVTAHDRLAAFYLTPYRAWEFALGALLAHGAAFLRVQMTPAVGNSLVALGLVAIVGTMGWYDDRIAFPGLVALLPVAGSAAVIAGGLAPEARMTARLLGNRPMVAIGLISYSLYLWHWPLLALSRDYALGERNLLRDLGLIGLSLLLAWATYYFVENPIRRKRPFPFSNVRNTLCTGLLLSLVVIANANILMTWSKGRDANLNAAASGSFAAAINGSELQCDQLHDAKNVMATSKCLVGASLGPGRLLAWGDSHSSQFGPLYGQVSKQLGTTTIMRALGSCPPLINAVPVKRDEVELNCGNFNEHVFDEALQLTHEGLRGVVLAGRWNAYMALPVTEPGGTYPFALGDKAIRSAEVGTPPLDPQGSQASLERALHDTVLALTNQHLRILVIAPVPELYFNGPQCLYRRSDIACRVPRAKVETRRKLATTAMKKALAGLDNVKYYDPIEAFCDSDYCYARRNGIVLYGDDNHVSPAMALYLGNDLVPLLRWAAGADN